MAFIPFLDKEYLPIAKNIRITLATGLIVSCMLIAVIGLTSWQALNSMSKQIESLVKDSEVKTGLIYDMRIAARERNLNLMMILLTDDPFEVDEVWMDFRQQGTVFLTSREKMISLGLRETEKKVLAKQRGFSRAAVGLQYEIYEHIQQGDRESALRVFNDHLAVQAKVFDALDELLNIQKNKNSVNMELARKSRAAALQTVSVLSFVVVLVMFLIISYIIKRLSAQALHIENESLKFKALIEGGMDAVLVLDKEKVVDCNVNALNMFAVSSLIELNNIGLDYFSLFSDDDLKESRKDIFSAVNHVLVDSNRKYQWNFTDTEGKKFPADVELTGIELQGEKFVQIIIRDVTERERTQKELRDANENLEAKVLERTEELKQVNSKIAGIARSAGMAEVASGVLHNVGNVLNSVNVSTSILKSQVKSCKSANLDKLAVLLKDNKEDLSEFLENDEKGKFIIPYLEKLSVQMTTDKEKQVQELGSLADNVEHIKNIISMQQSYAGNVGVIEKLHASEIFDDAVKINIASFEKNGIDLKIDYKDNPVMSIDKHKLIQILVNFLSNAKHAVLNESVKIDTKSISIGIEKVKGNVVFNVKDNGVGINQNDMGRLFEFGFKKRVGGHGYGLHHSALSAKDLGGDITVESDGLGKGANFILTVPIELKSTAS